MKTETRKSVARLLRAYLARAEAGEIEAIALVAVVAGSSGSESSAACGDDAADLHGLGFGLSVLHGQMVGSVIARAAHVAPVSPIIQFPRQ